MTLQPTGDFCRLSHDGSFNMAAGTNGFCPIFNYQEYRQISTMYTLNDIQIWVYLKILVRPENSQAIIMGKLLNQSSYLEVSHRLVLVYFGYIHNIYSAMTSQHILGFHGHSNFFYIPTIIVIIYNYIYISQLYPKYIPTILVNIYRYYQIYTTYIVIYIYI